MPDMQAWVLHGIRDLRLETRPIPVPKPGEVLIRMNHVGICGSDLHYYEDGCIGDYVVTTPMILGHEGGGTVVEVGAGVTTLTPGDRVAIEPGVPCGHCDYCKTGRYNLCPDVVFQATPPYDGAFAQYIAWPAKMCFLLPDNISTLAGAMIEPLSVGMHAAMQGGARPGMTAVVLGSGCIGLMTMLALHSMGVSKVYVTDIQPKRLAMAGTLGATGVWNAVQRDTVKQVMEFTHGRGADVVIETAGSAPTTAQTAELVAPGGTVVLVGMTPGGKLEYNLGALMNKEATLKTVFRYRNLYPTCIDVASRLPVTDVVTHVFPFAETDRAMAENSANRADIVKAAIVFDQA